MSNNTDDFIIDYVQQSKHSPSGKELINATTYFSGYSHHQAARGIGIAKQHNKIKILKTVDKVNYYEIV